MKTPEQLQQENTGLKLELITRVGELQVMSEEKAELKSQLEALQAYVERLREKTVQVHGEIWDEIQRRVEETHRPQPGKAGALRRVESILSLFDESPPQSLNHIEARVEEETIERCVDIVFPSSEVLGEELDNMPRKYVKQEKKGGE